MMKCPNCGDELVENFPTIDDDQMEPDYCGSCGYDPRVGY